MATRASGRIVDIRLQRDQAMVTLDTPNGGPKDNLWTLPTSHPNYNAIYSLCLAAAANRWSITFWIAGSGDIDPNEPAEMRNAAVGWI